MTKEELIENIIETEWNFFDKVHNEGGRASCQDDWPTFSVMRRSQYQAWSLPLIESWRADLQTAAQEDRNPLTEKYGYMMCVSDPQGSQETAAQLPQVPFEKRQLARRIVEKLLPLNEAFRRQYPRVAGRGRPLHTSEEAAAGWTSVETYETGELWTYSQKTLELLEKRLDELANEGKSYPEMVIENSLVQRGFKSLAEAEEYLKAKEKGAK